MIKFYQATFWDAATGFQTSHSGYEFPYLHIFASFDIIFNLFAIAISVYALFFSSFLIVSEFEYLWKLIICIFLVF